jgi:hypothetical protein
LVAGPLALAPFVMMVVGFRQKTAGLAVRKEIG